MASFDSPQSVGLNEIERTMNPRILIRNETSEDIGAIAELTVAAFKSVAISQHTEQFIVEALRAAGDLKLSLVANLCGERELCDSINFLCTPK